jgi:hypothetical protein
LLPFTEHGKRHRDEQWGKLVQISRYCEGRRLPAALGRPT